MQFDKEFYLDLFRSSHINWEENALRPKTYRQHVFDDVDDRYCYSFRNVF